ncbi:TetR/AcrR family transcriptional regulator, partial [Vibrio rotiferianus]
PEHQIDQWESKWQMLVFAHGAISLTPMMQETWPEDANNREKMLLNHWELFNTIMANQFSVNKEDMIHPSELSEIVTQMCCPIEELTA